MSAASASSGAVRAASMSQRHSGERTAPGFDSGAGRTPFIWQNRAAFQSLVTKERLVSTRAAPSFTSRPGPVADNTVKRSASAP